MEQKNLYQEPVFIEVQDEEDQSVPVQAEGPVPPVQAEEPLSPVQAPQQDPETHKGTVIQHGMFFKIDTYPKQRTTFVKNSLYSKILPNDVVLYRIESNGDVRLIKIIHRIPFHTIAIISGHDPESDLFFFHCPILVGSFKTAIPGKFIRGHPSNSTAIGTRFLIEIKRDHNRIIKCCGSINNRAKDSLILGALYTGSFQSIRKSYDLSIQKTANDIYRYPPGYDPSKGPVDLTKLNSFNVDPTKSRDFDDALSVDPKTNRIYVHIVDILQIDPNSITEKVMAFQGSTLYTPLKNHNILPDTLAEDKLSLIKGKPRKVITFEFSIDHTKPPAKGKLPILPDYAIYPSIITIKHRFDYDNALTSTHPALPYLKQLTEEYYSRKTNVSQPYYTYSHEPPNEGKLIGIEYEEDTWSHRLIEMLMINTNRLITEHFKEYFPDETDPNNKLPQRVHKEPIGDVLENVTGDPVIDGIIMIQRYKKAVYDQHQEGHYGLGLERYTHVTSPIRRFADVIVARMIAGYRYGNLDALLGHINQRERLNSTYEKQLRRWALMGYLEERMETIYDGYIVNGNPKGCKIFIKELGLDVFIQTKIKTTIGEKLRVKCKKISFIDPEDIVFEIV